MHHPACISPTGASRSATVTIGFLMRHLSIPFGVAFNQVACARPVVFPNKGFRTLLMAETKIICPELVLPPAIADNPFRKKLMSPGAVAKPPGILDMIWAVLDIEEQRRVAYHFSTSCITPNRAAPNATTDQDRMALILSTQKQRHDNNSSWLLVTKIRIVPWIIFKVIYSYIGCTLPSLQS